ncbi:hypothetical protein IP98_01398 [Flavobacterium cauense R2A-7]|uniref:Uncharacterized protein n=1 Tax=Flavobacterium cauense R2A-7 TaxID=1341154 RepID=A0A562LZ37_9FLAO|nr:hypothetical protein [Flavobacterium cauense]TWI12919.1 hypothetical protein IP98_01398 [Flavobacterium cauense R2A-7]
MKKENIYKNILGLTHEDTALMLGIGDGQWSMYVSGKRALPLSATEQLTKVLTHLKEKKSVCKESHAITQAEQQRLQEKWQYDYAGIQLKLLKIAKELDQIEKIRTEAFAALEVAAFLEQQKEYENRATLIRNIRIRATNILKKHHLYAVASLQLKKEQLEMLKNKLEQKIKESKNEL